MRLRRRDHGGHWDSGGHRASAAGIAETAYAVPHLAAHKTPRHWVFVEAFPLTPSGKVQKFVLREQFTSDPTPAVH
jgi:acyl-CoA synthetase (AMP-forming)/AMP-acid ligase II